MRTFSLVLLRTLIYLALVVFFMLNLSNTKNVAPIKINYPNTTYKVEKKITAISYFNDRTFYDANNYVKDILYTGDIDSFNTIQLFIGDQKYEINKTQIFPNKVSYSSIGVGYSLTKHLNIKRSSLPIIKEIINWDISLNSLIRIFKNPIIILLSLIYLLTFFPIKLNFLDSTIQTFTQKKMYTKKEYIFQYCYS
jgi:hypothetical protein